MGLFIVLIAVALLLPVSLFKTYTFLIITVIFGFANNILQFTVMAFVSNFGGLAINKLMVGIGLCGITTSAIGYVMSYFPINLTTY